MPDDARKASISASSEVVCDVLMPPTISAKEDTSSVLYEGRASHGERADSPRMEDGANLIDWRSRLTDALKASGRSMRDVSLACGLAPGYLFGILKEGKEPTVENAMKVCRELGVSFSYVTLGVSMTPEQEELLQLLEQNPERVSGILQILRAK